MADGLHVAGVAIGQAVDALRRNEGPGLTTGAFALDL